MIYFFLRHFCESPELLGLFQAMGVVAVLLQKLVRLPHFYKSFFPILIKRSVLLPGKANDFISS